MLVATEAIRKWRSRRLWGEVRGSRARGLTTQSALSLYCPWASVQLTFPLLQGVQVYVFTALPYKTSLAESAKRLFYLLYSNKLHCTSVARNCTAMSIANIPIKSAATRFFDV